MSKIKDLKEFPLWLLIAMAAILVAGTGFFLALGIQGLTNTLNVSSEISLTVLLISGLVALVLSLALVAAIYAKLELTDPEHSLGLPEGSVRAVIALSLILIFTILATYLFGQITDTNKAQIDFAKQILTTISTLVVAVAGFYFGTRAVSVAKGQPAKNEPKIVSPSESPVKLELKKDAKLKITLQTDPVGMAIEAKIKEGDDDGEIELLNHNQFQYIRGSAAKDTVVLEFALAVDLEKKVELTVVKN